MQSYILIEPTTLSNTFEKMNSILNRYNIFTEGEKVINMLKGLDPWDKKTGSAAVFQRIEREVRKGKWKKILKKIKNRKKKGK